MAKPDFNGTLPALITPFKENGEIDFDKLKVFVEWLLPNVHGFYVTGSYGSQPMLNADENKAIIKCVMETVAGKTAYKGRKPLILAHVGRCSTMETIDIAKFAVAQGVDAVAALTPYYYLHGLTGPKLITDHFKMIVDAVAKDVPVFLYNNPKYTNYCVTPDQMGELAAYGLAGMKDSSTSIQLCYDVIAAAKAAGRDDFVFLVGSQTMLYPCLGAGGQGCVSGMSNLFPGHINDIFDAAAAGDNAKAVALQQKANDLRHLTGSGIPLPFYHEALKYRWGIDIGYPRRPIQLLDEEKVKKVRAALDRYPDLR